MIALAVLLAAAAVAVEAPPLRFAVVVGYNGAPDGERPVLSYADDDAARIYTAQLAESERAWLLTTFDADSARAHPELTQIARAPTKEELAAVLGDVAWRIRAARAAGRKTELVFSFAGHGDVSASGEGFVVLADAPFTRSELQTQIVEASPADVNHVWIDACASYFMIAPRGGADATTTSVPLSPELLDVVAATRTKDAAAWAKTGTLVSTSDSAAVHESAALGSGVFSYLLRSALAGAADTNGDGRVEYAEAAAFIAAASAEIGDPRARLNVHAAAPLQAPHAAIGDLTRGADRRFLALDRQGYDHVRVLDAQGLPYVELHKGTNARMVVALAGSSFYVVQVDGSEATLVPRSAGAYALSSLIFSPSPKPRGGAGPFDALFTRPFDASFVDGYLAQSALPPPVAAAPLVVAFAPGATPPLRVPFGALAVGAFSTAGALALVSVGCAVMNLVTFAELQQQFEDSASYEPDTAFAVEAWRAGSTIAGAAAVAAALGGAAAWWAADAGEEGAP